MFVVYVLEVELLLMELAQNIEGEGLVLLELYRNTFCYFSDGFVLDLELEDPTPNDLHAHHIPDVLRSEDNALEVSLQKLQDVEQKADVKL